MRYDSWLLVVKSRLTSYLDTINQNRRKMGNVAQRSMQAFQSKEQEQTALSVSNHSTDSCETLETTTILTAVSRDSGQTEVLGYEVSYET